MSFPVRNLPISPPLSDTLPSGKLDRIAVENGPLIDIDSWFTYEKIDIDSWFSYENSDFPWFNGFHDG